jgi:exodeoxyribonuclease V gamma subunit
MVPQRSIPFRVIALLGLNDGEYPRGSSQRSLDLMAARPQLGDRDGRHDDRYLFLEALMSARDALHLSYLGEAVHDGTVRNPAVPLAELLGFLDAQHGLAEAPAEIRRPWLIRHPLQPFDERYFVPADQQSANGQAGDINADSAPDPRLYSYARHYADTAIAAEPGAQGWRFLDHAELEADGSGAGPEGDVNLDQLCRFYRRPGGWLCEQTLLLSRRALDVEATDDEEPLTAGLPPLDSSALTLVWQALQSGSDQISLAVPPRLARSGQLAPGPIGELGWEVLREKAQTLLGRACTLAPFERGHHQSAPQQIALALGDRRLSGQLDHVYSDRAGGLWLVTISQSKTLDFKHLLPWYLQWLCLRLDRPAEIGVHAALVHLDDKDGVRILGKHSIPESQLHASLAQLIDAFDHADMTARHYFPRTSFGYAEKLASGRGEPILHARALWEGNQNSKGECAYEPGYNALIGSDGAFLTPGDPQHAGFVDLATRLYANVAAAEHGVRDAA